MASGFEILFSRKGFEALGDGLRGKEKEGCLSVEVEVEADKIDVVGLVSAALDSLGEIS